MFLVSGDLYCAVNGVVIGKAFFPSLEFEKWLFDACSDENNGQCLLNDLWVLELNGGSLAALAKSTTGPVVGASMGARHDGTIYLSGGFSLLGKDPALAIPPRIWNPLLTNDDLVCRSSK